MAHIAKTPRGPRNKESVPTTRRMNGVPVPTDRKMGTSRETTRAHPPGDRQAPKPPRSGGRKAAILD